eukprot:CAMPEP_0114341660 /NCGR_PEP_ID=MMETSP0101-20121206/9196_1 /TAXON_ID=38822 ORGANISM="Pteridomonas danica, Strain PT" /NCGR_SAMPLE_ID=MMETSP0101 /ASSEMBLY_ACC=CAM_ASM_000211 /LENGTH=161 /DNA_ID=CAMNT_0001475339 /DNA_START=621 /DNA_END=1106 /DNA_ORIENTATION=+
MALIRQAIREDCSDDSDRDANKGDLITNDIFHLLDEELSTAYGFALAQALFDLVFTVLSLMLFLFIATETSEKVNRTVTSERSQKLKEQDRERAHELVERTLAQYARERKEAEALSLAQKDRPPVESTHPIYAVAVPSPPSSSSSLPTTSTTTATMDAPFV